MVGGVVVAGVVSLLGSSSGLSDLGLGSGSLNVCSLAPGFPCESNSSIAGLGGAGLDLAGIANTLLAIGVISGALMVFGGWLITSKIGGRRKIGAILAAVMLVIGGVTTFGGLVIGFILAGVGIYLALTYKSRGMMIGLGPVGTITLGSQPGPNVSNAPAGTGPLNYCIKCGSQVREGAVFCGACGARLVG